MAQLTESAREMLGRVSEMSEGDEAWGHTLTPSTERP